MDGIDGEGTASAIGHPLDRALDGSFAGRPAGRSDDDRGVPTPLSSQTTHVSDIGTGTAIPTTMRAETAKAVIPIDE
ncbi:hypothetical protein [Roseomonas chloroacetimidivorans]|uniref:hypothetical protein n=1 Tax=Roseomonas chloroacetimidivorans TaxID=1766656 RepID=UPI003C730FC6